MLTSRGISRGTAVGIGGDPTNGTGFVDVLEPLRRITTPSRSSRSAKLVAQMSRKRRIHRQQDEQAGHSFIAGQTALPDAAWACGCDHLWRRRHSRRRWQHCAAGAKVARHPMKLLSLRQRTFAKPRCKKKGVSGTFSNRSYGSSCLACCQVVALSLRMRSAFSLDR
jgi:succinyl-CoA synthetase alpha subunit